MRIRGFRRPFSAEKTGGRKAMRGDSMILLRSTGKKEIEVNDATIKRPAAYG